MVFQPEFVKRVDIFLEMLHVSLESKEGAPEKDLARFKHVMWNLLKAQWAKSPEHYDPELFESLPDTLKDPLLRIVIKEDRGTFKLDSGYEVPMFNYGGKVVTIPNIPNILCHIGSHNMIAYDAKGHTHGESANSQLIKAIKEAPKN